MHIYLILFILAHIFRFEQQGLQQFSNKYLQFNQMNLMMELQQAFNLVSNPNNQSIKKGEQVLRKLKKDSDYPLLLLNYMKQSNNNPQGKLRSAIELKIWCAYYESLQEYEREYYARSIEDVKSNILLAYLGYQGKIQKTLLPGIVSLANVLFPDHWQALVAGLIYYCREQDHHSTLKVLELLKQITQKYNYSSRSDPLYRQINKVCDELHNYLLEFTEKLVNNIVNLQHIPDNIKILQTLMRLFYNLNFQDLHPKFEDNLNNWMNILNMVMKLPNGNQGFFKCKGGALQSILLYASKYKDDVEQSIKGFSSQIWNLCSDAVSDDPQYDDVVFNSLKYFRSLIMWPDMKQFFSNNIQNLMKNLILPNIKITRGSMDLFNDEIQTFIAYYFRNAEIGTRRSAALQLLRSICRNFPNFSPFIEEQVKGFSIDPNNIETETLLLNLIMQSSAKAFRDVDGVTQLFINQNIITYCYQNFVKSRLEQFYTYSTNGQNNFIESNFNIIHVVMILRYIYYFRIYLPQEDLILILKLCCTLKSENPSLKEVIYLVINAFITIRHGDFMFFKQITPYFNQSTLGDTTVVVLQTIYENEQRSNRLNESLTKILYNISKHLKKGCVAYYDYFSYIFDEMLKKTAQYDFTSISGLFEALGIISYYMCTQKSPKLALLQEKVYNYFDSAIKSESDIVNFCFQILSIFAKYSAQNAFKYNSIYKSIINQNNWNEQNLSIMSSYAQYMSIYFQLDPSVIRDDKVAIHKILQRLVYLDRFDLFYRLLNDILKITGLDAFASEGYFEFTLHSSVQIMKKSPLALKTVLSFIFIITCNYNIQSAIKYMNQWIPNFYEICLLENKTLIQTLQARRERKLMYGSICNALATGCFTCIQNEGIVLNLLIDNSTGKFRFQKLSQAIKENEIKEKKESAFKKLQILKETEKSQEEINLDEQVTLVQTYRICIERNPNLTNMISPNNSERVKRLYQKHKDR